MDAIKLLKAILHAFHRRITKQFDPGTRQQTTHRLVLLSLIKVTFSGLQISHDPSRREINYRINLEYKPTVSGVPRNILFLILMGP